MLINRDDAIKLVEELPIGGGTLSSWINANESPMGATRRHIAEALRALPVSDGVTDEIVERVAQAIAGDLNRQDCIQEQDCINPLGPSLSWDYLDQGEVNFAQVARAALEAALGPLPAPPTIE